MVGGIESAAKKYKTNEKKKKKKPKNCLSLRSSPVVAQEKKAWPEMMNERNGIKGEKWLIKMR